MGFWHTAVCGDDVSAIARAIRYTGDRIGIGHVALGSDFDGAVAVPIDVAHLNQITQALQNEGFSDAEIRQIMGENTLKLFQRLLPAK
ncbi:MAG: membrane dipeptidase [Cyanobacteria bacterium P01_F01_bin.150]